MVQLSVIIVNYNVKHYLSLCLNSLIAATRSIASEIIVVDNDSQDGSVAYLEQNFPTIQLIKNSENIGFGKACNMGIQRSSGAYVLFINPDTLIGEDSLKHCLNIMDSSTAVGAMGIRLMDGQGRVLPESKRSIPSLWSSFCKFVGLTYFFPNQSIFNGYYAPEVHYYDSGNVEVLTGAFFLTRRSILQKLEGFDPRFFMYAEDIDLSHRIRQLGYSIFYDGRISALHFKGESTQKFLLSYTDTFFQSMVLFIQKYRGQLYGRWEATLLIFIVRWIKYILKFSTTVKNRWARPVIEDNNRFGHTVVLSDVNDIDLLLQKKFSFLSVRKGYPGRENNKGLPLRYIVDYLKLHPEMNVIIDVNRLSFSKILKLMESCPAHLYALMDGDKKFIVASQGKETQGRSWLI